jgi:CHASE3 domain sensor protein
MSNEKNLFEIATRQKFRFQFKGLISVEDLWDLSVKELDSIFKTLNLEFKKVNEESLLDTKTKKDEELEDKIEIVKYVVKTKLEEADLRKKVQEKKEKKQKILELISSKQDADLQNKSIDDLQKMLNELDD